MDQKVLASLVDSKTYSKLANNTLDIKAIKNNEIEENFSVLKRVKYQGSEAEGSASEENFESVNLKGLFSNRSLY